MCPYSYQHFAMSNITKVEPQKDDYNTPIRYYATDELHSNIRQSSPIYFSAKSNRLSNAIKKDCKHAAIKKVLRHIWRQWPSHL